MNELKPCIESAKLEIERLERQIKQMSELCLTVEEVNKLKAESFQAGFICGYNQEESLIFPEKEAAMFAEAYVNKEKPDEVKWPESEDRIDASGQNGNDGCHYALVHKAGVYEA